MHRFLQIHTLTSYPGSLLNRDDVGFAKRLPFGGADRVRISSQCLKRHWRTSDDEFSLSAIEKAGERVPLAIRSRRTFDEHVFKPLASEFGEEVARTLTSELIETVLPEGKKKKGTGEQEGGKGEAEMLTGQVTVIGAPEVRYLLGLARQAAIGASDATAAAKKWKETAKGDLRKNLQALAHGAGLDAALFGRMVTGDVLSRCDAAVHVAHAFTVHRGFFETDYFSAVDDLNPAGETGSGHINTSELTSGLYYGYVVVDVPLLVSNVEGCERQRWREADRELAAEVVRRLVHLIATVSPGAKLGSTAPYASALMVLIESGNSQPRTLANAFLEPIGNDGDLLRHAQECLASHVKELDEMYGWAGARRAAAIKPHEVLLEVAGAPQNLPALARWAAELVEERA